MTTAPAPRLFTFAGGSSGAWRVEQLRTVVGAGLPGASHVDVVAGGPEAAADAAWRLRGIVSNERYVERTEKDALVARQEGLGRGASSRAALIPIRKSASWWALTQDERRQVFEAQSNYIAIGLQYLPAIARRLHHCRDLSPEWRFVEREVDVRLARA
jgi:hypothetical protein